MTKAYTPQSAIEGVTQAQEKGSPPLPIKVLYLQRSCSPNPLSHLKSSITHHPHTRTGNTRWGPASLLPDLPASCPCFLAVFPIPPPEDSSTEGKVPLPLLPQIPLTIHRGLRGVSAKLQLKPKPCNTKGARTLCPKPRHGCHSALPSLGYLLPTVMAGPVPGGN